MIVQNYYEAHLRPLVAEVMMLSRGKCESPVNVLSDTKQLIFSHTEKKRIAAGSVVWQNLTEAQFKN